MQVKDSISEWRWYAQACTYHTIAYTGTETAFFVHWFCKTKATLNESWLVSDHFQSAEGADVCPHWPQSPGAQLSTLGWRSLTSTRKPKPAERKWNKMSGGKQKRGLRGIITVLMQSHISGHPCIQTWNLYLFFVHIFFVPISLN